MADEFPETDLDTPTEHDLDEAYGSRFLGVVDVGDKKIRTKISKVRNGRSERPRHGQNEEEARRLFRKHRQRFDLERHQQRNARRGFRENAGRLA